MTVKDSLTAAGRCPPVLHFLVEQAAGFDVGLQELALETVHRRVFAQSVGAGFDVGIRLDGAVAGVEGSLLQEITPVMGDRKIKSSQTQK